MPLQRDNGMASGIPAGNATTAPTPALKSALRQEITTRRRAMGETARQQTSERICQKIIALPQYAASRTLAAFAPMAEEINIWTLINHALAGGKTVALPRITNFSTRKMAFHPIIHRDVLKISEKGIAEPPPNTPMIKNQLFDFLLVPALAVDDSGNRLGYGGGFYDIFLSQQKNTFSCAPVFPCQLVDTVPNEAHDAKINLLITDHHQITP